MIKNIFNLLYPPFCHVCGKKIDLWHQTLCAECLKKIKKRVPPFCIKCGRQLPEGVKPYAICVNCKKNNIYFDRAFSVFYYDDILKELIHNFKYKKMTLIANEFVELIEAFMKEYEIDKGTDIVLSIPMHPVRLFKREINPSHILGKALAKRLGFRYSAKVLKKTKNTPPQSRLSRAERIKNIKESFSLSKNKISYIKHKNILLVDDLFTTGSTVNECARILKQGGSNYVKVITLARGDQLHI